MAPSANPAIPRELPIPEPPFWDRLLNLLGTGAALGIEANRVEGETYLAGGKSGCLCTPDNRKHARSIV